MKQGFATMFLNGGKTFQHHYFFSKGLFGRKTCFCFCSFSSTPFLVFFVDVFVLIVFKGGGG